MQRSDIMAYQDRLLEYARFQGPFDPLTRFAQHPIIQAVRNILSIPIILVQVVRTFVLGILVTVTFGLALAPLSLLWLPFFWSRLGIKLVMDKSSGDAPHLVSAGSFMGDGVTVVCSLYD